MHLEQVHTTHKVLEGANAARVHLCLLLARAGAPATTEVLRSDLPGLQLPAVVQESARVAVAAAAEHIQTIGRASS